MMKKLLFLILIVTTHTVVSQMTINNVLKDFSILKIYNGIDVEIIKSKEQRIEITGEKTDKVKIKQEGQTLKILMRFPETTAEGKVKAKLYYNKSIIIIDANEGAVVTGKDFKQQQIEVKAQEGAFVNLVVNTKDLKVKSTSGGVIKLSGETSNQTVNVDLGATYHGYNMNTTAFSLVRAGSGAKAEINSKESLDAKVTFGGTIFYKGTPEVLKVKKVIGGTIEQRN